MLAARAVRFATAQITSRGGRPKNQDCAGFRAAPHGACWVVADGLGGHQAGEVAAALAVSHILDAFEKASEVSADALAGLVDSANAAILAAQSGDASLATMRSTVVVLATDRHSVWWSHVGDSRLYIVSVCSIEPLTLDHSVPQALVDAGRITAAQIRGHEDRNRLLKALGSPNLSRAGASEAMPLACADGFLLCTDGFWESCTEADMERLYLTASTPEQWLKHLEANLLAERNDGRDNYTAVAVFVNHAPAGAI